MTMAEQVEKQEELIRKRRGVFNPIPCGVLLSNKAESDTSNKQITAAEFSKSLASSSQFLKISNAGTSPYPNMIRNADGSLSPAGGYRWANSDTPNVIRVELMPGLTEIEKGLCPQKEYKWVDPDDLKDFRVERIP